MSMREPAMIAPADPVQCGIHVDCERIVPLRIVLLDNIPTAAMFVLGAILMWRLGWLFGTAYLVYCILAIVGFWGRICPWCHHFATRACPCGYGVIAARFFKPKTGREFRSVFRANIVIMFPCFFIPPIAGALLLWNGYTPLNRRYPGDILLNRVRGDTDDIKVRWLQRLRNQEPMPLDDIESVPTWEK
jgi:hypothetical protein